MNKLSDAQRVILSSAAQRTDRLALPLPKSLKGGAAQKVVNALVDKGLLKEVKANRKLNDPVWRETEDGRAVTLETRVEAEVHAELRKRGHDLTSGPDWTMKVGGMQGVAVDPATGTYTGGCDPRRDGYVVPA